MSVPILTIPETAFDPSAYTGVRRQSNLVRYLLTLTRGSAGLLILAYLVGLFAIKPLLELTTIQRLDVLAACRGRLRDLYLNVIGRVNYIPIVAINKNDGTGKRYADAICQTNDLSAKEPESGALGLESVHEKISKLAEVLKQCNGFLVAQMPHYRVADFLVKDFKQKTDMVYFNQRELFEEPKDPRSKEKSKNLALEVKNNIRRIKGMFMSGQV